MARKAQGLILSVVFLLVGLPQALIAAVPASCAKLISAAKQAGAAGSDIKQAMEVLEDMRRNQGLSVVAYAKGGRQLINFSDPLLGGNPAVSAADWIGITINQSVSEDEMAVVIDALVNYLSANGSFIPGVAGKTGAGDGSTRLIKLLVNGNRGFFFEAAGTRSIILHGVQIQGRAITIADLQAMGVKAFTIGTDGTQISVEGDLVIAAGGGLSDFIDFKALGGNFTEDEIVRVVQAILNQAPGQMGSTTTRVNSFTFAVEDSVNLSTVLTKDTKVSFLDKFNELRSTLPPDLQSKLDIVRVSFK